MSGDVFSQESFRIKLHWGRHGAREGAARGDILVVVDVMSFSTAVATALARGAIVFPVATQEEAEALARRIGAEAAVGRPDVPRRGRFSLSPRTFEAATPGTRVVLASPNGATVLGYGNAAPYQFVGALVNASTVARTVSSLMKETGLGVTIVPAGEQWTPPTADGTMRAAEEDYLGTGAIISSLDGDRSPEAAICAGAFRSARDRLAELLWDCASGRELREWGCADEVTAASRLDMYDVAPVQRDAALQAFTPKDDPQQM